MDNRIEDRMMLKDLIDRYATESDKNNQDYYVEILCHRMSDSTVSLPLQPEATQFVDGGRDFGAFTTLQGCFEYE